MDNTTLILILALGGVGFYLVSKKTAPPPEPRIIVKERKLSSSEALGGAIGKIAEALSIG